jgi:hypothetical protein
VFDELADNSPVPLVSIVDACANEARRRNLRRPLLLGTRFTMEASFYSGPSGAGDSGAWSRSVEFICIRQLRIPAVRDLTDRVAAVGRPCHSIGNS